MNFNFKRIYPGLGKTQQKIMAVLEKGRYTKTSIHGLTSRVFHPRPPWEEMVEYTKSESSNTHRAVRALKKRGLVWTKVFFLPGPNGHRVKTLGVASKQRLDAEKREHEELVAQIKSTI